MSRETILATLPGSHEGERLLVVLLATDCANRLELRQQSFGEGIGWFTQSSVQLEPSQVALLRSVLGTGNQSPRPSLPTSFSRVAPAAWQPRLVQADSA